MEMTELRIGNNVMLDGVICKVAKLGDLITPIILEVPTDNMVFSQQIKPIPLTEEWLLKFGLDKGNKIIDEYYYFNIDIKSNKAYINDGEGYEGADVLAKINYVHQLQNLYYALTGQELKM